MQASSPPMVLYNRYIDDIFAIFEVGEEDVVIYGPKTEAFLSELDKVLSLPFHIDTGELEEEV